MQAVEDISRGILGHSLYIDGIAGPVNNGRGRDAIWIDIAAGQARGIGRGFSLREDRRFPKDGGGTATDALRVHRVDGVVFRSHVQNVLVSLSRDRNLAEEERLAVDLAVDGNL